MAKKKKPSDDAPDMRKFGGVLFVRHGGDPDDPADQLWNFGVMGKPGIEGPVIADSAPNLYDIAPHMQGQWDGKSDICPHDAVRKVLGKNMPSQMQPKGTCGGRTAKMAAQVLQCVMIAAGKQAKYHPVSHAWPYFLARKEYGMLGGGDGVPDGSIPPVMSKYGLLHAEEAGDTKDYGAGSDDLAAKWGGRGGAPKEMFDLAADNKVLPNLVKVRSIREYMDGAASGGIGCVSSMRGFTMTRDADGICKPQGSWAHYMATEGGAMIRGHLYVPIDQSWGKNTPSGPTIQDGRWPDHTFAADSEVVERDMMKGGSLHLIFGYPLWDEKAMINWRDI